jgi:16S rRNA (cytidine1402-2'-O)-methyltransferase
MTELDRLIDRVVGGEDVAVVTDAGMPGVSDPGGKLVARAVAHGVIVESVPGPSALTTAASLSGLPTDQFLFLGFLPHKKGRQTLFKRIDESVETVILYESPHRLLKTLDALLRMIRNKPIVVCRELTKIHESIVRGTAAEVMKYFQDHPDEVRGEIVIIIGPLS